MNVTPDTNMLVRVLVQDDPVQAQAAQTVLRTAKQVAVTRVALCELTWVLARTYGYARLEIADAIEALLGAENVAFDRNAAATGIAMLRAGADFADGVIAAEGAALGAQTFVSFDGKAVDRLLRIGIEARAP